MFERSETIFKILCAGVGAIVVLQVARALHRSDPLGDARIPALPHLASSNSPAGAAATQPSSKAATNALSATNTAKAAKAKSDRSDSSDRSDASTNAAKATNTLAHQTNPAPNTNAGPAKTTNALAQTALSSTNAPRQEAPAKGTNTLAQATNASAAPPAGKAARANLAGRPAGARAGINAGPFPGGPPGMMAMGPPLPPEVQARVDQIIESELLAPVMHPQPLALLGMLGREALLRAPNGQTGAVKEGDELGGVKVLKLGINRVLVEEAGEKKELSLFSGLGSESLLSTQTDSPK